MSAVSDETAKAKQTKTPSTTANRVNAIRHAPEQATTEDVVFLLDLIADIAINTAVAQFMYERAPVGDARNALWWM